MERNSAPSKKIPQALAFSNLNSSVASVNSVANKFLLFPPFYSIRNPIIKVDTFEPGVIWEKKWFLVLRKLILIILK